MPAPRSVFFEAEHSGWVYEVAPQFCEWLGCRRLDLLGRGWVHYVDPQDQDAIRKAIDLLQVGELPAPGTIRWRTARGTVVATHITILRSFRLKDQPHVIGRLKRVWEVAA